jgi:dephospho-CoA kinase
MMTLHVVLTGGVASGKSVVSQYFEELGVTVIDADIIAREVVAVGSEGLKKIQQFFGPSVIDNDGSLDRRALRQIVFNDDEKREWLNQLLHPMIRQRMSELRQAAESCDESYTISAIPLYFETIHGTDEAQNYHRVLVVDTTEKVQLERLMERDDTSLEQAQSLMASQASREQRLSIADDIISNNSDLQSLKQQVIKLDKHYHDLARS